MRRLLLLLSMIMILSITGCGRKLPTTEHKLMLEVRCMNWDCVDTTSDYFISGNWYIYYDGEVEYHHVYNFSGITDERKWTLTKEQRNKLYRILTSGFKRYTEDYNGCDGNGWQFSFYDENGELIHMFTGYIYNNRTMNKIVSIISSEQ